MDTDSSIMHIETEDFYKDIANDVEKWFDASNYDEKDNRPLPIGINGRVLGMYRNEPAGKIMRKLCGPRAKTQAYLMSDGINKKKPKGTKKCVIKCELKFNDYYDSIFENKNILESQQGFTSDHHTVYTEEINKIAISSNDDKRIQTYDKITTYPYGTSVFRICEVEIKALLKKRKK